MRFGVLQALDNSDAVSAGAIVTVTNTPGKVGEIACMLQLAGFDYEVVVAEPMKL
jgi:hypothetical protein